MKHLTPRIIAKITNGEYVGDESASNLNVQGAARDDSDVKSGNLFVCIKGKNVDGHSFANAAFESGAVCCLAEKEIKDAKGPYVLVPSTLDAIKILAAYYRSLFDIPFVGITGSVGKTSSKEIISAVLSERYNTLRTKGNLNNEIGVPLTLLSLDETHEAAVIEMGISNFGDMSRLAQMVRPNIFVMTKIGHSHLDMLSDLKGVLEAKTEAFHYMKSDGIAVLNGDDELLKSYEPGMKKYLFGLGEDNDICISNIKKDGTNSITCDVRAGDSAIVKAPCNFEVTIPTYGSHITELMGSAVAVGLLLDLTANEITRGFANYKPVDGRSNIIDTGKIKIINDCYNANPTSVKAALTSLSELRLRKVAILGDMLDMGMHSEELHHEVGGLARNAGIDCLICVGIKASDIFKGYMPTNSDTAYYYETKEELIPMLPNLINKNDAVLVKASNGMKFSEIVEALREIK